MIGSVQAALVLVGIVEVVAGFVLFVMWMDVRDSEASLRERRRRCPVCLTGASVTSFAMLGGQWCDYHGAHWQLIRDLEKKTGMS